MEKVIIKSRKGELTEELFEFALDSLAWFRSDLGGGEFGKDWDSCAYGFGSFHGIAKLHKSGTITITVEK